MLFLAGHAVLTSVRHLRLSKYAVHLKLNGFLRSHRKPRPEQHDDGCILRVSIQVYLAHARNSSHRSFAVACAHTLSFPLYALIIQAWSPSSFFQTSLLVFIS